MGTFEPLRFSGDRPPLGLIAGPTASGKSAYAVALAQAVEASGKKAVIVNADASQMYADLRVLSARPAPAEMGGIEHRLFGEWDGAQAGSAAEWSMLARAEIAAIHAAGGVPILVGGTGLYLRTLLDGLAPVPAIPPDVRAEVRSMPQEAARAALEREDAASAARLAPADRTRTQRALEVVRATGTSITDWHRRKDGGIGQAVALDARVILPPRTALYARCDMRFAAMLDQGALEEVAALIARDLAWSLPVMRAIGVREIAALLRGDIPLDEAMRQGRTATRQYAKRQYTWFSHQPPPAWQRVHRFP